MWAYLLNESALGRYVSNNHDPASHVIVYSGFAWKGLQAKLIVVEHASGVFVQQKCLSEFSKEENMPANIVVKKLFWVKLGYLVDTLWYQINVIRLI